MQLKKRYNDPDQRSAIILQAAVELCRKPGGWIGLTRIRIARRAKCSEALVSRYMGDMRGARRAIMRQAMSLGIREIVEQSRAANDGFAPKK